MSNEAKERRRMENGWRPRALRGLVRLFLRLFPDDIEGLGRSEMEETFFDGYRVQRRSGRALRFLLREIPNLAGQGLAARFSQREGSGGLGGLTDDLRFALKSLRRQPSFAVAAVLTLALGVGVNTAAFSVVTGEARILDRFRDPDHLVFLWGVEDGWDQAPVPLSEYVAWRTQATAFQDMGCYYHTYGYLRGSGGPLRARVARTSVNLLPMLGLEPEVGRLFGPADADPAAPPVVVLTHRFWQERYGGRPDIVGQTVFLNDVAQTIVGVLPAKVEFEMLWRGVSLFTPLPVAAGSAGGGDAWVNAMARLAGNATLDGAEDQITAIAAHLAQSMPDLYTQTRARAQPFREFFLPLDEKLAWAATLAAVSAVLLIACVNLANLLMAKGVTRQGEVAIRMAVGASRGRMIRQLLVESLMLALAGGAVGIAMGRWGLSLFLSVSPTLPALRQEMGLDLSLFSYSLAISVVAALAFGLTPALLAARVPLVQGVRESSPGASAARRKRRLRSWILAAQIALTVPLVLTCAVSLLNVRALQRTDFGFRLQNLTTAQVSLPSYRYREPSQQVRFLKDAIEAVRSVPGVSRVAIGADLPIGPGPGTIHAPLVVEGREGMQAGARGPNGYLPVSNEYFTTLGVALRRGRAFDDGDEPGTPLVAVVNEAFARLYWPGQEPLGKRLVPETDPSETNSDHSLAGPTPIRVVGVVADFGATFHGDAPEPTLYVAESQFPSVGSTLVVRTNGDRPDLASAIREAVAALDPAVPVTGFRSGKGMVDDWLRESRSVGAALSVIALLALGMAALGLYGLVAHSVAQRTFELGVRTVLGAGAGQLRLAVMRSYLLIAGIGVLVGVLISIALGAVARSFLVLLQVSYLPMTLGTMGLLIGVTIVAAYLPARRATLVQPVVALRAE
jgi:putative ABC transport system permease protein